MSAAPGPHRSGEPVSLLEQPSVPPRQAPALALRRSLFVAWKADCFRSRATARTFGAPVEFLGRGPGRAPWRYLALMWRTWRLLEARRPATVLCLNQPPMLPLVCQLWTQLRGGHVIQDFHSAALSAPRWRVFRPLYRWMARRAPVTLVHNRSDAQALRAWRAETSVLLTLPAAPREGLARRVEGARPRFLFVCTFAADEPVQLALQAFAQCPEADFWITGNYRKAGLDPQHMPANVRLLGFVPYAQYEQALASSTAVITLSDRPHIMQMAVEEAITLGVPVLTNHSPTLQEALGEAGEYVALSANAIAAGVRSLLAREADIGRAASGARERCWQAVAAELERLRLRRPELFA